MTLPRILVLALGGILLLAAVHVADVRSSFCLDRLPLGSASVSVSDETVIDETFSVQPGELLEIRLAHSNLIITPGPSDQARVRVTLSGRNMERARAFFEHLNFSVEKSGRTLSIATNPRGRWSDGGGADIEVIVSVPEVFDADVRTSHGDVEVGSMKGRLNFEASHGDLDLGTLTGSLLSVSGSHGDIDAGVLAGEKIRLEASHGDIDAGEVVAADIETSVQHGDIAIERLEGRPSMSVQHGNIDVALSKVEGGRFESSHGDIRISAPASMAVDLDLRASEIEIGSSFEFQGTQRRELVEGRLNGGGPRVLAHASHGSVELRGH